MDKRKQSGTRLRGSPSLETTAGSSTWSHELSMRGRTSTTKASSDSLTATSTPPSTPSTHQTSKGIGESHANSSKAGIDDDQLSLSSAASADLDNVEYYPAEDSSDGSGPETVKTLKRSSTQQNSSRFVRYLSRKLGRTFNKKAGFRGKAFLPNDQIERERNTRKHPEALILGIDVEPVRPPYLLPNCRFETIDASQPWSFDHTFDFIHMRMVGELPNGKHKLFETMWEHLMPGGWIEITEWIVKFQSPNHSLNMFNIWNKNFKRGLRKFGSSPNWALQWKAIMQDRGCLNVQERRHPVPLNPWPPGQRLQKQGQMMAENVQAFLEGATMPVFTGALGWTHDQVQELLAALRKEVVDTEVHGFLTL
ncbi:hypothetical protein SCAR479_13484 [Seiridium cardinale]|uniref:Uncharacterized protein n=1 Tax=Seiridium cardinale TaxID=138064 RepID=A0ABR2X7S1_9PEZI